MRNPEICCLAEVVMKNTYISNWNELLQKCNLQRYEKEIPKLITEMEVIILDGSLNELYRYNINE